jgi:hypothetical protein
MIKSTAGAVLLHDLWWMARDCRQSDFSTILMKPMELDPNV